MTSPRRLLVMLSVLLVCCATALSAHPLSTFGAQLNVTGRRVTITINADIAPLVTKLDVLTRVSTEGHPPLERVSTHRAAIEGFSTLTADGTVIRLSAAEPTLNADGQMEIALTGELPPAAQTLTWQSHLIFGTYPMSVTHGSDATETVLWLEGQEISEPIPVQHASAHVATLARYTALGFEHILPKGLDHILFVLGLCLLTPRLRPLLAQVSVFTLAHSVSLALAISGVITLPASVVEPLIALSIAYVGVENLFRSTLGPYRLWLVGAFGLLHGLGFAGVLADLSLPSGQWLTALLGFNVGVELGQLSVIAMATTIMVAWTRWVPASDHALRRPASALIAVMGMFWVITRL